MDINSLFEEAFCVDDEKRATVAIERAHFGESTGAPLPACSWACGLLNTDAQALAARYGTGESEHAAVRVPTH